MQIRQVNRKNIIYVSNYLANKQTTTIAHYCYNCFLYDLFILFLLFDALVWSELRGCGEGLHVAMEEGVEVLGKDGS